MKSVQTFEALKIRSKTKYEKIEIFGQNKKMYGIG
jgi:hypothetical protein